MTIAIRPECPEDFPIIHDLVRTAFENAEYASGDEHFLVDRLRGSREYIPELSLVAEEDGRIVGHIMFTRLKVGEATALTLAPLAVPPSHQGRGIGGALIRRGHEIARSLGWEFVILVGHAGYYPRFGYKSAASFGIVSPFEVPEEAFMAINLRGGAERLPGLLQYSPAFFPESPA
ncbi:MAG: N-acetyltransferase [Desulfovibrio sp.]|uniref:GNAT family N-acetyltransferase n=1 Tax=Desulfovibrio sp. TaxID=885 RepID=UPI0025BB38B4|nr:N-acetyltransferase [Desulfovibrio sp.]MBS6830713.1 N-acetyltransferase [Desulfovibrio sp.]